MRIFNRAKAFLQDNGGKELLKGMRNEVRILEVGPRDGIQFENKLISTKAKGELIQNLTNARISVIECGSLPRYQLKNPQMADGGILTRHFEKSPDTTYEVFIDHPAMVKDAVKANYDQITFMITPSVNMLKTNIEGNYKIVEEIIERGKEQGVSSHGYIGFAFGSPLEREIDNCLVVDMVLRLRGMGCKEITLSDNISAATPSKVSSLLSAFPSNWNGELSVHFHETSKLGVENIIAALGEGIGGLATSIGGLGRCNYHKSDVGNVATEDAIFLLQLLNIHHGVLLPNLFHAAHLISAHFQKDPISIQLHEYNQLAPNILSLRQQLLP